MIWEEASECGGVFYFADAYNVKECQEIDAVIPIHETKKGDVFYTEQPVPEHDIYRVDEILDDVSSSDRPCQIGYKLPTKFYSPLLRVSQAVRRESQAVWQRQDFNALATSVSYNLLHMRPMTSKEARFCKASRFDLFTFTSTSLRWLMGLTPDLASCITSLSIHDHCLYNDDMATDIAWSCPRRAQDASFTPFTSVLRERITGLREVSIYSPIEPSRYCTKAPEELCNMLEDGTIDTLRYLLNYHVRDFSKWWTFQDCLWKAHVDEHNIDTSINYHLAWMKRYEVAKAQGPRFAATIECSENLRRSDLGATLRSRAVPQPFDQWRRTKTVMRLQRHPVDEWPPNWKNLSPSPELFRIW